MEDNEPRPSWSEPGSRSFTDPFVGRARELEQLRDALDHAVAGHGSLFLISGEPGIGKSRLIAAAAGLAEDRGFAVLVGRCWEGGGAPAYWPWIQIARAAKEGSSAILAAFEGTHAPARSSVSDATDPDTARFQLFDGVGRFLVDATEQQPCLIVLEDLHASDEPSLHLLRFVAGVAPEHPFLVLGSYREEDFRARELADTFGQLVRLGQRIPLHGLSTDEVARYIALVSGEAPSDAFVTRLGDLTGGNPLFLGEIVRELTAQDRWGGMDGTASLPLPEGIRALIRRRVAGLSPEAANLLRIASVIGRDWDVRVIAAATTLGADRILDVLAEAERAGLIVEGRGSPTYSFAHELLRETLYDDLPTAKRMDLHLMLGDALEELFAADIEPHLAEIAHHLAHAAPLGGSERAAEFSLRAADRAREVLAYEDAARLYQRCLRLLGPRKEASPEGARITLLLGDALSRAGNTDEARQAFERAATVARRHDDTEVLALAALGYGQAGLRVAFGGLLLTAHFRAGETALALLEEALEALPDDDGSLRARILAMLAIELYPTEHRERRLSLSQQAVDMALRIADPQALVEALYGRHWATLTPDTVAERLENAQQMLLTATVSGKEEFAFLARHARVHCFLELGDVGRLDDEIQAMDQLAQKIRQPIYVWHAASLRAMRTLLTGASARAEREVRQAWEVSGLEANADVRYMLEYAQLVAIHWTQGRLAESGHRIEEHGRRFPGIPRWRDALAAADLDDIAGARAEIERFSRDDFAGLPRDGLWILHACSLAEAAVLVRDRRRATILHDLLSPFSDRNAISVSTLPFGPVALRLAMIDTLLERWDDAEKHLQQAVDLCDAMGASGIRARVSIEWARMLLARRGSDDRERADALLAEARRSCRELDLPGIEGRADNLDGGASRHGRGIREVDLPRAVFRRNGQVWTIAYGLENASLHDRKGLRYIASLLGAPGLEVHVLELAATPSAEDLGWVDDAIRAEKATVAMPLLDAEAKDAYRRRLAELAEDLEEARSWNDPGRAARIEDEIAAIATELERSVGLGGRARETPSPAERARVSVTKAIRSALRVVSEHCPSLGEHLTTSIRTGRFCTYAPPGREPPRWEL